uniref:NADH dehydrogenase [ubiquinone] iron-sulfur protein 4, mitochondrial n=1 Tax=Hirondellea gigas TaxID=1518452 RepID=A0A6A7FQ57_9CRUS
MALRRGLSVLNLQVSRHIITQSVRSVSLSSVHRVDELKKKQVEPRGLEYLDEQQDHSLTISIDVPLDLTSISGVPEEHVKPRRVLIKKPTKNSMQSGSDNIQKWQMIFDTQERWENPLMGWSSSADPLANLDLEFGSKEDAICFCEKNGWQWALQEPPQKPPRAKSYAANFSWNKRTRRSCK